MITDPLEREALRERLLKSSEVAKFYGVTTKTLGNWIRAGRIEATRTPGGQYRVRGAAVEAQLARSSTNSNPMKQDGPAPVMTHQDEPLMIHPA
ncbi:helix-turn-helix domain-containing protein [Microbispora triticiradicis]|uniref:helix-turn-helix domain-containing protein n=1 Tax=Microbispora triticiradicis TaxID=2200763 RepID=UPI001AD73F04|nr:helix-turn-helix domain-containing protein [Microbispora triticiradicis]MBO4271332.1 helix-turn-helix domain-containing protein [Microbispora triticiradicis]